MSDDPTLVEIVDALEGQLRLMEQMVETLERHQGYIDTLQRGLELLLKREVGDA